MVYKKKGKSGSKLMNGIEVMNEECRSCVYRTKGTCTGRHDAFVPCLFAKTEVSNSEAWERV